jgi:demethylmenaquinone methyltransferase/2-methoxy-6-polyprenyl-1,4-benzoquinol methylase
MLAPKPGEHILEIGPGTGHALLDMAARVGPSGRVCGLDLSAGMLSVSHRRLVRKAYQERTWLVRGDGVALPFVEGAFQAALMTFTLELFPATEMQLLLRDLERVLAPGARLGIVAMARPKEAGLMSRLYAWAHHRWPRVVDCRPIDLHDTLLEAGYGLLQMRSTAIWGLPVALAVATPGDAN